MDKYKIKIYATAKRDLQDIVDYLNTLQSDAAIKYYDFIIEKIGSLELMAERCPYVRNTVLKAKGYRYLIVKQYLVFYVIKGNTVQIRRILYGKRNYETLL